MNFKNLNEAFENKFSVSRSLLREEQEKEESRQLSKKRFLESIDRTLTEKNWKFTIPGTFRNAIFDAGDEEDYEGVRQALISICEYVVDNIKESEFDVDEQEEIAEEFADFIEELEYMDFEDEDEANYYLNDLYDLLDNTDIFLGLREGFEEDNPEEFARRHSDRGNKTERDKYRSKRGHQQLNSVHRDDFFDNKKLSGFMNDHLSNKKPIKEKELSNKANQIVDDGFGRDNFNKFPPNYSSSGQQYTHWQDDTNKNTRAGKYNRLLQQTPGLKDTLKQERELKRKQKELSDKISKDDKLKSAHDEIKGLFGESLNEEKDWMTDARKMGYSFKELQKMFLDETGKDPNLKQNHSEFTAWCKDYFKNESLNEEDDNIDKSIKEKVIKKFNQEKDKSDIEHYIDDDGFGFHIIRQDGGELVYDASTGKFEFTPAKKLGEGKVTGGGMPPKDVATIEPLINDFDKIEEANKDILYITWNFGRRLSDDKMTAGVDISTYRRDSEESLDMYLEAIENAIQKNGFKFDDSLGYDNEHWRKHAFGNGYHTQIIEDVEEVVEESFGYKPSFDEWYFQETGVNTSDLTDEQYDELWADEDLMNHYRKFCDSLDESLNEEYEEVDISDYKYVGNVDGFSTYRKIITDENGKMRGIWAAQDQDEKEPPFRITYDQALGYEPIKDTHGIKRLSRDLGRLLLPRDESLNEEYAYRNMDALHELDREIEDYLNQNNFHGFIDLYDINPNDEPVPSITYHINGDWKHEHLRFKYLVKEFLDSKNIIYMMTEREYPSGSDSYEADYTIHLMKHEDDINEGIDIESTNESLEENVPGGNYFEPGIENANDNLDNTIDNYKGEEPPFNESLPKEIKKDIDRIVKTHGAHNIPKWQIQSIAQDNPNYSKEIWRYASDLEYPDNDINEQLESGYYPSEWDTDFEDELENLGIEPQRGVYVGYQYRVPNRRLASKMVKLAKEFGYDDSWVEGNTLYLKWSRPEKEYHKSPYDECLTEDTIKQNDKWVNKGKEGTHGTFKTKKEADAQRKAMFANGFKG